MALGTDLMPYSWGLMRHENMGKYHEKLTKWSTRPILLYNFCSCFVFCTICSAETYHNQDHSVISDKGLSGQGYRVRSIMVNYFGFV